jgi:CarD family transcriptional regulator
VKSKSGGKATKLPARKATAPKQSQMESKILKANRTPNRPAKVQAPRSPSDRSSIQPIVEKVPHRASHPTASEQPVREAPAREVKASINGNAKPVTAVLKARVPANESGRKSGDRAGGAGRTRILLRGRLRVYPTHGVGRVVAIETQQIAGISLPLIVITFDKDRMTLRVPVAKAPQFRLAQALKPQSDGYRARHIEGTLPREAHNVEPPRAGIRGKDQLR